MSSTSPRISEVTRRDIFDGLTSRETVWSGRLGEAEFLSRIFDLSVIPLDDLRCEDVADEIALHRVANPNDWPDDWVFYDGRFGLLTASDETFLRFLCEMVHPVVRRDSAEAEALVTFLNELLERDGFEIAEGTRISGRPVFVGRPKALRASSGLLMYRDIKHIGSGGYGEVLLCERVADGAQFAKKVLHDLDPEAQARFAREVRLLQKLDHKNIVSVIMADLSAASPYYVMPLYKQSLEDELATLVGNEARIKPIFELILDGLEYAHARGVLHRDLKPLNVLMNSDSDIVLSDFGLGRHIDAATTRKTLTGRQLGTFLYMSPEQMSDAKRADHRSDIYAIGRMLWELYAGTEAIAAFDYAALPTRIAAFVRRCTERDAAKRFQSVSDLKATWARIFDSTTITTERTQLVELIRDFSMAGTRYDLRFESFIERLEAHLDDDDLVSDAVVDIDEAFFLVAYQRKRASTTAVLKRFAAIVATKSWGFDYTDKLARSCRSLFMLIPDFDVRADLVSATIELGAGHNRFYVLGVAASMLLHKKEPGETLPLVERLSQVSEYSRGKVVGYLDVQELHPDLKPLFTFQA